MSKVLVHDYEFFAESNGRIVIPDLIKKERFLLATNVTSNESMFLFNSTTLGMSSFKQDLQARTTTITLDKDCSTMTDSDNIQIFYEGDGNLIQPVESYTDPVSKLRVSNPQNLIDTDFEYGLQSSKWETIELVKNIPTFFSRDGDTGLQISSISVQNGSNEVTVQLAENHGFSTGAPVIIIGSDDPRCNGAFVARSVPTDTSFTFVAKQTMDFNGTINNSGTQLFFGSIYQGTEFKLDNLNPITTDGDSAGSAAGGSRLTLVTKDATKFTPGTSFYLTNSIGTKATPFNTSNVDTKDANTLGTGKGAAPAYIKFQIDDTLTGHRRTEGVQPYAVLGEAEYSGTWSKAQTWGRINRGGGYNQLYTESTVASDPKTQFFLPSEITLNKTTSEISFSKVHNLHHYQCYYIDCGLGNQLGNISGEYSLPIQNQFGPGLYNNKNGIYLVKVVNSTTIKLSRQMYPYNSVPSDHTFNTGRYDDEIVFDGGLFKVMFAPAYQVYATYPYDDALQIRFSHWWNSTSYWYGNYYSNAGNWWGYKNYGNIPDWIYNTSSTSRQPFIHIRTDYQGSGVNDPEASLNHYMMSWNNNQSGSMAKPPYGAAYGGLNSYNIQYAQSYFSSYYYRYYVYTYLRGYWSPTGGSYKNNYYQSYYYPYSSTTTGTSFIIPVSIQDDFNVVYKQNHGLETGQMYMIDSADNYNLDSDAATIYKNQGAGPNPLSSWSRNRAHQITKIDDNSFKMSYEAPYVTSDIQWRGAIATDSAGRTFSHGLALIPPANPQGYSSAGIAGGYIEGAETGNYKRNVGDGGVPFTISLPNHKIAEGTAATYDANGGTVIGGLSDQGSYFVNATTVDKIRLGSQSQSIFPAGFNKHTGTQNDVASNFHKLQKVESTYNGHHRITFTSGGGAAMGWQAGDMVQYIKSGQDILGLVDGAFYFITGARTGVGTNVGVDEYQLKYHDSDAINIRSGLSWSETAYPDRFENRGIVPIYTNYNNSSSPIGDFRHTSIVPFTSATGGQTHNLLMVGAGAVDGVYDITSANPDGKTYTLNAGTQIPLRAIEVVGMTHINSRDNVISQVAHGLSSGAPVTYTHNNIPLGNFTAGDTYYVINSGKDQFKLATTQQDALNGIARSIDSASSNYGAVTTTHTFTTSSVSGELKADGTVSTSAGSKTVTGSATQFTSKFSPGDEVKICIADSAQSFAVTFNTSTNTVTSSGPAFTLGEPVTFTAAGTLPSPLIQNNIYYIGFLSNGGLTGEIHSTYDHAVSNTQSTGLTGGSGTFTATTKYAKLQGYDTQQIKFVNSNTNMELVSMADSDRTGADFMIGTSFLMRADGFALHRPYDGGVELIPSTNPDSQMIRQTRKYFRYQSGKGIQNSLAISFSPAVDVDTFAADSSIGTITTREDHRLTTGLNVTFNGATVSSSPNLYNKSYTVQSIPTNRTFTVKFDQLLTLDSTSINLLAGETITQANSGATGEVRRFAEDSDTVYGSNILTLKNVSGTFTTNAADTLSGSSSGTLYQYPTSIVTTPGSTPAGGIIRYHVDAWANSVIRAGLFDDQNGLFWEFDGQNLGCVVRSSVQQLSGTAAVTFNSAIINGTNTKFTSQLSEDDKIVLKGQTYRVIEIQSDTSLTVLPSYRGASNNRVIVTKTIDNKVTQPNWNVDKADGKGKTGYKLDLTKIQMAYIDYSWYGAGKVRFGFKDQKGDVKYVHQFIHNNQNTEAYMRSGNVPGRYEIENLGAPSYVPALAHWGTSVIMDGRFDDDKAYIFTASGQTITQTGQGALSAINMRAFHSGYYYYEPNNWYPRQLPYALEVENPNVLLNSIREGDTITGANLPGGSSRARRSDYHTSWIDNYLPNGRSPYQPGVPVSMSEFGTITTKNLLFIDEQPSGTTASYSGYTTSLSQAESIPITSSYPLVSIRLAPSVDTNTPGLLGEKEIINRMQLALKSVGILTTHAVEVELRLNSSLDNNNWQRVTVPSLSQLVYHGQEDQVTAGNTIFSFRAGGGTGATNRTPILTEQDLSGISDLGNSILGGDNVFPDGPDIITVVATLVEDPGTISNNNPWQMAGRISWAESQA